MDPISGSEYRAVFTGNHPSSESVSSPHRRDKGHPIVRLCDLTSNAIVWQLNCTHGISAVAFSSDGSLVAGSNDMGQVSLWNIALQNSSRSASRSRIETGNSPLFLCEMNARTSGSDDLVNHITFSADNCAIITYDEYTPIPLFDSPPTPTRNDSSTPPSTPHLVDTSLLVPSYYMASDGWIWLAQSEQERRRVRWLPPAYRFTPGQRGWEIRGGWDICGHRIALASNDGLLAVVDVLDRQ